MGALEAPRTGESMKFALGMPGLILYPPITSSWESEANADDILRVARKADQVGWD